MATDTSPLLNASLLQARLAQKTRSAKRLLQAKHPQAVALLEKAGIDPGKIRQHATKLLTTGALAGTLLFSGAADATPKTALLTAVSPLALREQLAKTLRLLLPQNVGPLTPEAEQKITNLLQGASGIKAVAQLEGNRLNQSYGLIGAEQHLPRYPGDSLEQHQDYLPAGITPGLGAWGYFAATGDQLDQSLILKEKYYVAVQTLYLPNWEKRLPYLREWYKYRKVIVVNPANGLAVVADVADAGPAAWTGKHFGGSPEVMAHLGLNVGMQKGPVILFFVDDPNNQVPLGPVEYNGEKGPVFLTST